MAIVSVKELAEMRRASETSTQDSSVRTYTRVFLVTTNSKHDGPKLVKDAATIPRRGEQYPDDLFVYMANKYVEAIAPPMAWHVICEYTSEWSFGQNPLSDPAIISWKAEQFERPTWKDRNGEAILNSAGGFYPTLPMMDDSHFVASVQKNVSIIPVWVTTYQDALNISPFTIDGIAVAAELAKLQSLQIGDWQERNNVLYRVLSFDIHFRADGWALSILDQGFARRGLASRGEDITKDFAIRREGDMTPSEQPMLLNGLGQKLSPANPTTAVFLDFDVYRLRDFNLLPLT